MKPARFSKRAQKDLEQIRNYIAADGPDAADQVWQALLEMADLLAENMVNFHRIVVERAEGSMAHLRLTLS